MSDSNDDRPFRPFQSQYRWPGVDLLAYKEEGSAPFRSVTRQVLFSGNGLTGELRYFEVGPGGHSTLERHQHAHGVMILKGRGHAMVGRAVSAVAPYDLVTIPGWSWHQFRAPADEALGFLCMVNAERDKPQLPTEADLAMLRADDAVAAFLDGLAG
ncbi:1-methylthio-xylulose 5-phosphate sulfo-lyase [Rhodospirillum rubrum]|uniref:1-methylthio-D-xylulose 5-phosphate methylsulfurylase n=1 Tax=Rhodospirillum rubrum (strain ATCC 11170 / ATH 1.1.1 / DSM 467 / LMG 4362 / NCIMB 8255 / S1) TaxID=269796 RepID=CUPIN_RHORT|nr:1-methylthio-xylulose 5-phosphate sulfo-lyase [Rhodospirillum rubrum]Q2RSU5.1 RecName: Full=1-methylthio-D-xylulose 5-phosphate methylsulfurylase; Short=MTXu 5-P methylsulfurylase; AltName: Full=1-methylthio-xylulose 5-phosphate sulfo-lyase [Rhodospirillum rubrum ATCC 11170]ABC22800.1 conserved hypothetical protein [Rhodospirillum rubrum ATCC 11170]AEO48522.1 hypothetical protein F11_10280 [Rhodospirillum rubrum F11]MBK5954398.1 cupin [Rhodospirillum rubrum]QXG78790.1 1-methylthio-xylulose 